MTPQSKILLVFLFIVAVVLFVVLRKKKEKVKRKKNYSKVIGMTLDLDESELKISE